MLIEERFLVFEPSVPRENIVYRLGSQLKSSRSCHIHRICPQIGPGLSRPRETLKAGAITAWAQSFPAGICECRTGSPTPVLIEHASKRICIHQVLLMRNAYDSTMQTRQYLKATPSHRSPFHFTPTPRPNHA